ncbi:androgen-induced gene 1 protein isoform X2 [Poeciliopsis prolifica]|uniref:androgen-induced gene 1 protein isoform X2 n=1 Tax=Poeciliopsis prolifica TaxID=188132 RepID=UPI0024140C08|nr:androgen-induced gene 1 protein isoform X2 [Poeciliopsis prolifica]
MALIPAQVLRVAILLSYFSILCHYKALDMPAHQTYGGSWKFLTFIDLHTTVLPFIIIEMRTTHHSYPRRSWGLAAVCLFGVGYILWTCWVHQVTGVWVYPVLERIAPLARVAFFSTMTAVICIMYVLGEILNGYIWDHTHTEKVKGE